MKPVRVVTADGEEITVRPLTTPERLGYNLAYAVGWIARPLAYAAGWLAGGIAEFLSKLRRNS
jgi:hypothetical protein